MHYLIVICLPIYGIVSCTVHIQFILYFHSCQFKLKKKNCFIINFLRKSLVPHHSYTKKFFASGARVPRISYKFVRGFLKFALKMTKLGLSSLLVSHTLTRKYGIYIKKYILLGHPSIHSFLIKFAHRYIIINCLY